MRHRVPHGQVIHVVLRELFEVVLCGLVLAVGAVGPGFETLLLGMLPRVGDLGGVASQVVGRIDVSTEVADRLNRHAAVGRRANPDFDGFAADGRRRVGRVFTLCTGLNPLVDRAIKPDRLKEFGALLDLGGLLHADGRERPAEQEPAHDNQGQNPSGHDDPIRRQPRLTVVALCIVVSHGSLLDG